MLRQMPLIFAHPNDESFALGGTIAKYAEEGVNITLVVATKGEAGKVAGICKPEDLGLKKWQAVSEHKIQIFSRQKFEALEETAILDYFKQEYFQGDQELSAFPGRGKDLFGDLERVEA